MRATLGEEAKPTSLRAGAQPAIAASADDAQFVVELELISILEGSAFHGSGRSRAFLRFVVEETLAGRQEALKERAIGAAVLGKPSDYDTGADATVRVRANEVRKRLAAHYESHPPKGAVRIELPAGSYAPRFSPVGRAAPQPAPQRRPPPMLLWQLATPTVIAAFLALISIRGVVETSDAFSLFWNRALAGGTEIVVAVDSDAGGSISPQMADAALPMENLAGALQVPVHIVAANDSRTARAFVVRLSLKEKPAGRAPVRLARGEVFRGNAHDPAIWLWAENAEALRAVAQSLSSRSGFPLVE